MPGIRRDGSSRSSSLRSIYPMDAAWPRRTHSRTNRVSGLGFAEHMPARSKPRPKARALIRSDGPGGGPISPADGAFNFQPPGALWSAQVSLAIAPSFLLVRPAIPIPTAHPVLTILPRTPRSLGLGPGQPVRLLREPHGPSPMHRHREHESAGIIDFAGQTSLHHRGAEVGLDTPQPHARRTVEDPRSR